MSEHPEKELSELEQALRALEPAPSAINRDQLMFKAGRASALAPPGRGWQIATVCASATALCLALILALRPIPDPQVRFVTLAPPLPEIAQQLPAHEVIPKEVTPHEASPVRDIFAGPFSWGAEFPSWRMQQMALRWGVGSLPVWVPDDSPEPAVASRVLEDLRLELRPRFTLDWQTVLFGE